ncbi:MAG: pyrroline-5-carboxylate reductase [Akkermansiaceae bacterium]
MKLGVIGCGKMATALVKGAISSGVVDARDVVGVARSKLSCERFSEQTGARASVKISDAVEASEVIIVATKPHDLATALEHSNLSSYPDKLLISVVAGVTVEKISHLVSNNCRVARAMPNTPSLIGKGATGFCMGQHATDADRSMVESILRAVGLAVEVPERLIDAVTGVSGSGPAYIYLVIEAMADGGVRAGLPREDAINLAAQTVSGAAEMVLETGMHPAILKDMVASPGGTTIAGLAALEEHKVRSAFIGAVEAAANRARELGGN